jgi:hypothetical protein
MIVYEVFVVTFSYWDNDYTIAYNEIFSKEEDALIYYDSQVDRIKEEYLKEASVKTMEEFEEYDEYNYTYEDTTFNEKTNSPKLFHMSIDEYGHDTVYLYKKHVMKFS